MTTSRFLVSYIIMQSTFTVTGVKYNNGDMREVGETSQTTRRNCAHLNIISFFCFVVLLGQFFLINIIGA